MRVLSSAALLGAASALVGLRVARRNGHATGDRARAEQVRQASDRFYAALNRMFTGDTEPLEAIWSHAPDVTNMGPLGGRQEGWREVRGLFARVSAMQLSGRVEARDVLVRADGEMGYVVCLERGEHMTIAGRPIQVEHRATNVFRHENGEWRLVHHHTDPSPDLQGAARR